MPRSKSGVEAEVALDLFLDAGDLLGLGQLEDRLGVVGHRAVAVHGDGDRPHAQEAERHQAEGEDGAVRTHDVNQLGGTPACLHGADDVGDGHQAGDEHAHPEGAEVAGDDAGRIVSDAPPSREAVTIS